MHHNTLYVYLKFEGNDLKGFKLWGKSTYSIKAALTYNYSDVYIMLKVVELIEYT